MLVVSLIDIIKATTTYTLIIKVPWGLDCRLETQVPARPLGPITNTILSGLLVGP